MKIFFKLLFSATFFTLCCSKTVLAQSEDQNLVSTILLKDSLFWTTYNNCNFESMQQYFTDDVEFYHDKGGITLGAKELVASVAKNICGNPDHKIRREVVAGSVQVFPMKNNGKIYGAVISGSHLFYIKDKGKDEYADGLAKFTHLWILKNSVWKMCRLLSYDHGPAPYVNKRKQKTLPTKTLSRFAGKYNGPQTGVMTITQDEGTLLLSFATKQVELYPESSSIFFTKDRDLTFEFVTDQKGNVVKLIVREHGAVAEEAPLQK